MKNEKDVIAEGRDKRPELRAGQQAAPELASRVEKRPELPVHEKGPEPLTDEQAAEYAADPALALRSIKVTAEDAVVNGDEPMLRWALQDIAQVSAAFVNAPSPAPKDGVRGTYKDCPTCAHRDNPGARGPCKSCTRLWTAENGGHTDNWAPADPPKRCEDCRATGALHCSDPENCGGPWTGDAQ